MFVNALQYPVIADVLGIDRFRKCVLPLTIPPQTIYSFTIIKAGKFKCLSALCAQGYVQTGFKQPNSLEN